MKQTVTLTEIELKRLIKESIYEIVFSKKFRTTHLREYIYLVR